jgi:DNA-directed RNA polymerase subunit H (RpoH/RPB5)
MRVLVIGRENEENLLRRGLVPPRSLPRAEQSQPNFVALTYQRHTQR